MKKRYIYSGIGVVFLLICLGLVWRGTGDDVLSGKTAGETGLYEKQVPFLYRDALMGEILHSFEPWVWDVKKVDWGPEELVKHMWEQMAQLRNTQWQITREEAEQYVHEMRFDWYEKYNENPPDNELSLWYQGMEFSFYGEKERLLEYHPTTIFLNPNSRKLVEENHLSVPKPINQFISQEGKDHE